MLFSFVTVLASQAKHMNDIHMVSPDKEDFTVNRHNHISVSWTLGYYMYHRRNLLQNKDLGLVIWMYAKHYSACGEKIFSYYHNSLLSL